MSRATGLFVLAAANKGSKNVGLERTSLNLNKIVNNKYTINQNNNNRIKKN